MSDTVKGIRDFYHAAVDKQFLRDFNFRVMDIKTHELVLPENEIVYATADKLPGRTITNHVQPFMGFPINYAGTAKYDGSEAYQMKFFIDETSMIRQKLERASRIVFNDYNSTGNYRVPGEESGVITLALVDPGLKVLVYYKLIGAQFRKISELSMDYLAGEGKLVMADCTISYQFYEVYPGTAQSSGGNATGSGSIDLGNIQSINQLNGYTGRNKGTSA